MNFRISKFHRLISNRKYTYSNKLNEYLNKYKAIELPEKFKGTFVEKWMTYWKDVFRDYVDVVKDAAKDLSNSPWKGIGLVTTFSSCTYFIKTNPDENSFKNRYITHCNSLILVGKPIRNPDSVNHLKYIEQCYNEGIIRRFSFGLLSVMWVDNYNNNVSVYKAMCPYLKPQYLKLHERVLDIGFMNKWWIIDRKMIDVDINPEEWNSKTP